MVAPLALLGRAVASSAVRNRLRQSRASAAQSLVQSVSVNVTSNISTVSKALDAFGKNQLPFATHRALNDTAFQVRNHIVKRTHPKSFDVKSRTFARAAYRVIRSPNKRKLEAAVVDRFEYDYLARQAEGGVKTKRGRYIAIPAQERPVVRSRASHAKNNPRTILANPKAFQQNVDGQDMILQRRTKKRYPLKRMYLLHEQDVRIPKRFPFYEEGTRIANRNFAVNFRKRFAEARSTAGRR